MTRFRILSWASILVLLVSLTGVVQAHPRVLSQPGKALVYVPLPTPGAVARLEHIGLPVYARLQGHEGEYLLAGATPAELDALTATGLRARVLDTDMAGATYYLVYPTPGRAIPDWDTYGRVLLNDGVQVLMRVSPQRAEDLAETGAQLRALTLDPKPLRPVSTPRDWAPVTEPDPFIQAMIEQVDSTTIYSYTGDLSGEWPAMVSGQPYTIDTRHTYSSEPILKATRYVGEHLGNLGLDVEYHQWDQITYPNVIGELVGETNPNDVYIICAHLDDMPQYPPAPGADDNASGVVGVLVAADILTQYHWGCTLRFAVWTGEEQGLNGSRYYAQRAYQSGENIVGVLNLDMISWNTPGSSPDIDLVARSSVPGSLDLAQLFADVVDAYDLDLTPQILPNGTGASDHASFWTYGYTAILGIEDQADFNPRYHSSYDLLEYADLPYYTDFVKAALATFVHMSDCLIPEVCVPLSNPSFTWTPDPAIVDQAVTFTGVVSGTGPLSFAWDFGDGTAGQGTRVDHAYATTGLHTVTMTATNTCSQAVVTRTVSSICYPVTGVTLSQVTTGTLRVGDAVAFRADLAPDSLNKPYHYQVTVDGAPGAVAEASADPLAFDVTFATTGTHHVLVQAWNCDLTVPVGDTMEVPGVLPAWHRFYLPLVLKAHSPGL